MYRRGSWRREGKVKEYFVRTSFVLHHYVTEVSPLLKEFLAIAETRSSINF